MYFFFILSTSSWKDSFPQTSIIPIQISSSTHANQLEFFGNKRPGRHTYYTYEDILKI